MASWETVVNAVVVGLLLLIAGGIWRFVDAVITLSAWRAQHEKWHEDNDNRRR